MFAIAFDMVMSPPLDPPNGERNKTIVDCFPSSPPSAGGVACLPFRQDGGFSIPPIGGGVLLDGYGLPAGR